jgi:CRISPR-associated protein Csx17
MILRLVRPLMALDWENVTNEIKATKSEVRQWLQQPDDRHELRIAEQLSLYGILRLCYHYEPLFVAHSSPTDQPGNSEPPDEDRQLVPVAVKLEVQPFQRLLAGDLAGAVRAGSRRLRISGLDPHVDIAVGSRPLAERIAAALAIPISNISTRLLVEALTHPTLDSRELPLEGAELDYEIA